MREILFRGKRTDNGEWVEGYFGESRKKDICYIIKRAGGDSCSEYFIDFEVNPETVGQFTGLVDKHGDRKWEGDIFKFGDHIYIIEWDDDDLAFWANEPFEPDYSVALAEFSADEVEVIGNVHDNPELISV